MTKESLARSIIIIFFLSVHMLPAGEHQPAGHRKISPPPLQILLKKLREAESLYGNISYTLSYSYRSPDHHPALNREKDFRTSNGTGIPAYSTDYTVRVVQQNEYFRVDRHGTHGWANGKSTTCDFLSGFNGKTTRTLSKNDTGNIFDGRSENEHLINPHDLLLFAMGTSTRIPLSVYLAGDDAIFSYPDFPYHRSWYTVSAEYYGEEEIDGLACHKVGYSILHRSTGSLVYARKFWLAKDRTLLPVKCESIDATYSTWRPCCEASVESMNEISPGLWFPVKLQCSLFKKEGLEIGRIDIHWNKDITVSDISLNTSHPVAFFEDIPFPEGTHVDHVAPKPARPSTTDKQKSADTETHPAQVPPPSNNRNDFLVCLIILLLLLLGSLVYFRKPRIRSIQHGTTELNRK
ncbi:MAG: hypothetical protein KDA68_21430 [Planctomycetaceae bacterium]|nr:hypothetical protein [Planctomycetaceae bacterium]